MGVTPPWPSVGLQRQVAARRPPGLRHLGQGTPVRSPHPTTSPHASARPAMPTTTCCSGATTETCPRACVVKALPPRPRGRRPGETATARSAGRRVHACVSGWDLTRQGGLSSPRTVRCFSPSWSSGRLAGLRSPHCGPTRGQNIGTALLDGNHEGCAGQLLPVGLRSNDGALASFYARHGLVELEHRGRHERGKRAPDLRDGLAGAGAARSTRGLIDEVDQYWRPAVWRWLTAAIQAHQVRHPRDPREAKDAAKRWRAPALWASSCPGSYR